MTKIILAGFLLLQICKQVLGGGPANSGSRVTVDCFDNSTHSAKPIRSTLYKVGDFVSDFEVIKSKIGALGSERETVMDLKANKTLLAFNETGCFATSIVPFLKDNYLVLCAEGNSLLQLDSKGKTLARVNITANGEGVDIPKGFAADKKGNVYFGTIDERRPSEHPLNRTGVIYIVRKPYDNANVIISSKSISVVVKNVDYAGGIALTDNDQTLLITSASSDVYKFTLKDYKVTRAKPSLFANVTRFYPSLQEEGFETSWHDIAISKNNVLVAVADKVLVLSQNGKTLLRTISIVAANPKSDINSALQTPITSIFADNNSGSIKIAFLFFGADASFVLSIEQSAFGYSSRPGQDIVCKATLPEQPTAATDPAEHVTDVAAD
ncbi:hypothetical protein HDU81_004751 [Chytriomyces hyalinus]|nr:hypothetical protein HDU81_004751 [Chytriomyces hyalinus]